MLGFGILTLKPTASWERPIVLASRTEAMRLRQDGWQPVAERDALWRFDGMGGIDRVSAWDLRQFVNEARLSVFSLRDVRDNQLADIVRRAIRNQDVLAFQQGGDTAAPSPTTVRRRLVREIAGKTRNRLSHAGRQYKLVADVDLDGLPDRDYHEVVGQDEAKKILAGLASEPAMPTELLTKASADLTKDWRKPFSQPDGLILLRRAPVVRARVADEGPALTPSQMRKLIEEAALDILVVDLDKTPQEGLAYRIKAPDGNVATGKLDKEGRARVKSSLPGVFTVAFPELDGADWDGDGAMELPPEETRAEASRHKVAQGERLATIAGQYDFACWQTVWNFKGNQALKDLRGDPNVLSPGDEVVIPTKLQRDAEVPGGTATYVVNRGAEVLRVCFPVGWDWDGDPVSYTAKPDTGGPDLTGPLDSEGWMEIALPPNTSQVDVALWIDVPDSPIVSYALRVGEIDPIDEVTGVQARLANLGYYDGAVDGDAKEVTAAAIAQFRREHGLPMGDQIDDDLRDALDSMHDADEAPADTEPDQTFADDDAAEDDDSPDATQDEAADRTQEGDDDGDEDSDEDDDWIEDDDWDGDWEEEDEDGDDDGEDTGEDTDEESSDGSPQE
jgi:N-acetylmuramoyl-L-alanine amidase